MSRSAGNGNEFADHTPGLVAFLDGDHQPLSLGADGSPKTAPSRIQRELVRCDRQPPLATPVDAAVGKAGDEQGAVGNGSEPPAREQGAQIPSRDGKKAGAESALTDFLPQNGSDTYNLAI